MHLDQAHLNQMHLNQTHFNQKQQMTTHDIKMVCNIN